MERPLVPTTRSLCLTTRSVTATVGRLSRSGVQIAAAVPRNQHAAFAAKIKQPLALRIFAQDMQISFRVDAVIG